MTKIDRYGFNVNDIGIYVSYESLSPSYKAFVVSLQSVSIPTNWKKAKEDSKWRMAMVEELEALCKNKNMGAERRQSVASGFTL
jgi:hypothetical protein